MRVPSIQAFVQIHDTNDGNKWLSFDEIGFIDMLKVRWFLRIREGFKRKGEHIEGFGEWISPDYVRGTIRLGAGGDTWFGPNLIAYDEEGSNYLKKLHDAFSQNRLCN